MTIYQIESIIVYTQRTEDGNSCWLNVGPPSPMLGQHKTIIEMTSCVCWVWDKRRFKEGQTTGRTPSDKCKVMWLTRI